MRQNHNGGDITYTSENTNPETIQNQETTTNMTQHDQMANNGTIMTQQAASTTSRDEQPTHLQKPWGNTLIGKAKGQMRLLVQNIRGIDMTNSGSIKLGAMQGFITPQAEVDIIALMECNTAWMEAPHHLYPVEQMRYWWENAHWGIGHNKHEHFDSLYQPGGTGLVVLNWLSYCAQ